MDTAKLKANRKKRGLSMEDAARRAGLSGRQVWYMIESGRRTNLTLATLDRIAKVLGCKPGDLLK